MTEARKRYAEYSCIDANGQGFNLIIDRQNFHRVTREHFDTDPVRRSMGELLALVGETPQDSIIGEDGFEYFSYKILTTTGRESAYIAINDVYEYDWYGEGMRTAQ